MSNRITPEKINAIAYEYYSNGFIKSKALEAVGYSKNYANHCGLKIFDDDRIKQAIKRLDTKNQVNTDISVKSIQSDLQTVYDLAINKNDISTALQAKIALGKTIGAFTDNLNTADITKQKELDEIETIEAQRIASIRLKEAM